MISGLMNTRRSVRSGLTSITITCWWTLTCVAARPTPSAAYMVSVMSETSLRVVASIFSTRAAGKCSRGSGYCRISRMAINACE